MRYIKKARLLAATLPLLFMAVGACATSGSGAVVALPDGYYLQRDRASLVEIVNGNGRVVVPGPIAGYAVHRHIVTGCVANESRKSGSYPNDAPLGELADARYFVLDTRTGKITTGLNPADWKNRLKELDPTISADIWAPVLPQ